jgi:hypothetical protein
MSNKLVYYKQILQKVSFDVRLFRKELRKAYRYLTPDDCDILRQWVDEFTMTRLDLKLALHSL